MLGTVYSPKIAKINSQQEKTIRLNSKNKYPPPPPPPPPPHPPPPKIANQQKFTPAKISWHTVTGTGVLHHQDPREQGKVMPCTGRVR